MEFITERKSHTYPESFWIKYSLITALPYKFLNKALKIP